MNTVNKVLTKDLNVAGGYSLPHTVDSLAGVDPRVTLSEARDVQCHMTKVKRAAAASTWAGRSIIIAHV